jgi:hypothetical protein
MEPATVRDHFLSLLICSNIRTALIPLLSQPMEGHSLADSQWLWSAVLIFVDPSEAPDGVRACARDYVRAVIHAESVEPAAAAFLQCVNLPSS